MQPMKFGFTFIQRCQNGAVENAALQPFDSFAECCGAAEKAVARHGLHVAGRVEIVPCDYDEQGCYPQLMSVIKSFEPS